jgi:hypothetical protein
MIGTVCIKTDSPEKLAQGINQFLDKFKHLMLCDDSASPVGKLFNIIHVSTFNYMEMKPMAQIPNAVFAVVIIFDAAAGANTQDELPLLNEGDNNAKKD